MTAEIASEPASPDRPAPTRVAIVGGGCAGIAAAYELSRPELAGRYQVTVYQQGWRLGGKGASGRGPSSRIEEHGLHVWLGYYENAFRLLRECYAELDLDWRAAFRRESAIGVMERDAAGAWRPWLAHFPTNNEEPGAPHEELEWPPGQGFDYLAAGARLLITLLASARSLESGGEARARPSASNDVASLIGWLASGAEVAALIVLLEGSRFSGWLLGASATASRDGALARAVRALQSAVQDRLDATLDRNAELRRVWGLVDVVLANLGGMLADRLVLDPRGFDAIDHWDYREWLLHHGASRHAVDSPVVRGLYDLAFAYEDGDPSKPRFAAGVALRCALRTFFTYKGALFWKMNGGMGDVVFAPFYQALRRRGVRFAFFHRLEHVALETDEFGLHVAALEFDVQAKTHGEAPYEPLIDVNQQACWPAAPDFAQLVEGDRLRAEGWDFESHWDTRAAERRVLHEGQDFDQVVLAVGLGALPHLVPELVAADRAWAELLTRVKTVATQAFQLWLDPALEDLGWRRGPVSLSGFVEPFDTWADMTHLRDLEEWAAPPGTVAYFCSTLRDEPKPSSREDAAYPLRQRAAVRGNAVRFLDRDVVHLWPAAGRAEGGSGFPWQILRDATAQSTAGDERRFDTQYWTANVNPSDRYVLCLPGTVEARISPLDQTCDNLTVAGDWTETGLNAGCVEGAFMSGRLAAHALAQSPPLHEIVGYDHP